MSARRSISMVFMWLCAAAGGLLLWSAPASAQRMHAFSSSFGGEGSGVGQLSRPGKLAVNEATGDVYVIDRGNGRVEIFNSSGVYVGQFNGSAAPTGAFSWPFYGVPNKEVAEGSIAVDNSANPLDPSKGDVYVLDNGHEVIDKFTASGVYVGQLTGAKVSGVSGLSVDPEGALWTERFVGFIQQFNDASPVNEYVSTPSLHIPNEGTHTGVLGVVGLALDPEGNLYTGVKPSPFVVYTYPIEFSKTGEPLIEKVDSEETSALAVDESSSDVYVDHETSVAAYSPSHLFVERFGSAQMQASEGIAVDSSTGTIYTANASTQEIDVFSAFIVPDVSTGSASSLAETSATVNGFVDPDGLPVTSCVFEYGTSSAYGQSMPCSVTPAGSAPVEVTAHLTGLGQLTNYHFRLNVSNASGSNQGQDHTFVTPEPVALSEEVVSDVSSTSALFSVQVNPGGADTTYQFEYGTSVSYGESVPVPAGDLGSGKSSVTAAVRAQDLLGETTYHVRVVASNLLGTVYGPDEAFTTQGAGGAFVLPDGREWEMVSPPVKDGAKILALGEASTPLGQHGLIEASAGGDAFSYGASGPVGANARGNAVPSGFPQVLSRRGPDGWSSEDITPPISAAGEGAETEYTFFSSDLARAIVEPPGSAPLSPEATEETPYVRDSESEIYEPLVSAGNVPLGTKFSPERQDAPNAVATTADLSHVVVQSAFALTANALEAFSGYNLYEWSGGRLQLLNERPDHTVSSGEANLGGDAGQDTRNALSSDGSRIFFALGSNELDMRDTATGQTVRVDAPAPGVPTPPASKADFQIASADGSKVFFTDEEPLTADSKLQPQQPAETSGFEDLYVYEAGSGSLTDLSVDRNAGEPAGVQDAVVGASEDGTIVYFVATGKLAEGAESGQDNLYVESQTGSSWSPPRLVAVLSEEDSPDWMEPLDSSHLHELQNLTSRVSANGRYLAFMSDRSLTGYDNRDVLSGSPDEEVFLYDEATAALRCVSCNPTGARPDGVLDGGSEDPDGPLVDQVHTWPGRWLAASIPGWMVSKANIGKSMSHQVRVLFDDGRLFFDSADALVAQDTNGREDVYEYEPQGAGSCARPGGCVALISSGVSAQESALLEASETGDDVFFLTTARLVPADLDSVFDAYDAHACSAASPCLSSPEIPPPCSSGDSCKAAPSPQPAIFGAPPSATFSGAGNVTPEPPPAAKPAKQKTVTGKRSRCAAGKRLSHGRCVRVRRRRAAGKTRKSDRGGRR